MSADAVAWHTFLLVFVRCSAMFVVAPVFGAANVPVRIRLFGALAVSMALSPALDASRWPVSQDILSLAGAVGREALIGIVMGAFLSLVTQAAQIAGGIADLQMGLGISQTLNPLTGVQVSVLSQFKFLLATVVYLSVDGHHTMLQAFAASYGPVPLDGAALVVAIQENLLGLVGAVMLLALQIAAPILAVSMVIDAALGLVNKAVPTMAALQVGLPAKIIMGLLALSVALPAVATGVDAGLELAVRHLSDVLGAG